MKAQARKDYYELLETMNFTALENEFYSQQAKAQSKGKYTTEKSGIAFRELLKRPEFDYIKKEFIKIGYKNSGSVMEYLIARDIYGNENHTVDNAKGNDYKGVWGWTYQIKAFTNNSAPHGYATKAEWVKMATQNRFQFTFSIDNRVFRMNGQTLESIIDQIDFKEDKNELRIKASEKNFDLLVNNSIELDTVALF